MKEIRYFYAPDAAQGILPEEETNHILKVLRYKVGDRLNLANGKGMLYEAEITDTDRHNISFQIIEAREIPSLWKGKLHIAMAPTKNADRTEWFLEKATEIGIDQITMIDCEFSERNKVNPLRSEKILISAMKQSHKARLPKFENMIHFKDFIRKPFNGRKFIAHCYEELELCPGGKPFLLDLARGREENTLILVGPEGDFSVEEVKAAINEGFVPVNLGKSRLRTETAALVAVHLINIANR